MIVFVQYLEAYLKKIPVYKLIWTTLLTAFLVTVNYTLGLEKNFKSISPWPLSWLLFFLFYSIVFFTAHAISSGRKLQDMRQRNFFFFLIVAAAFLFAGKAITWKLSAILPGNATDPWNHYWSIVLQLPAKLCVLLAAIYAIWKWGEYPRPFFGLTIRGIRILPYIQLILLMIPVIALAAMRPDFQHTYPRMQAVAFMPGTLYKLLFEISYGLDFVSIELFFRALLVLGFIRFVGEDAMLPMAAFYCTVHFGKPLGECISSYFGGILLGVVAYRTRSVVGGLMVHLGIAWLMELAGWLAH